jgi:surface protein
LVSDGNTINSIVDWGDGTTSAVTAFNDVDTLHDYNVTTGAAGLKTITISGLFSGWQFNNGGDRLKMRNVSSWGALKISVDRGFYGCSSLTASATDAPVITTTSLAVYFGACLSFNGAIGNWDVSTVTNMADVFNGCSVFNQPIGNWNVTNVTFMGGMFFNAQTFNQDIGNWNVINVTSFNGFMRTKTAANYSAQNLASIYNQWSQLTLKPNVVIEFNTIDYCDTAEANKQSIVTNFGWSITDGNAVPCP